MLYHYTGIEKLVNILATRRLWLTNISCFKDVHEFTHAVSLLSKELSLSPRVEQELRSELTRQNDLLFVGCFCSESDRLFLWKEYGGYNIEFAEQDLRAMVDYQAYMGQVSSYSNLLPCEYDKKRQDRIITNALSQWKKGGNVIFGKEFSHLATSFKHPKYCPEQETRLVVQLKNCIAIKTRETDTTITKYWELPLRSYGGPLPIRSITVGPTRYPEKTIRDLRGSLLAYRLGPVTINHSKIAYQEFIDSQRSEMTGRGKTKGGDT
jgi:hypothetical protein